MSKLHIYMLEMSCDDKRKRSLTLIPCGTKWEDEIREPPYRPAVTNDRWDRCARRRGVTAICATAITYLKT